MKLGRVRSRDDHRDFMLARYLTAPSDLWAPPARDWRFVGGVPTGMPIKFSSFGNLSVGDCTCASVLHAEQAASVQNGIASDASTSLAFDAYEGISDWNRKRPTENDDGAQIRDSIMWFRSKGIVRAAVRLDETNQAELKIANNLGMVILGWDLPKAWQGKRVWDVSPTGETGGVWARRSWGGHATLSAKANRDEGGVVSWANEDDANAAVGRYEYTWPAQRTYCDEAWLLIMEKWVRRAEADGSLVPNGFDLHRLLADVAKVAA